MTATRKSWGIWIESITTRSSTLYGNGYLYATEEAARRGVERLIAAGELIRDKDGTVRTSGLDWRGRPTQWDLALRPPPARPALRRARAARRLRARPRRRRSMEPMRLSNLTVEVIGGSLDGLRVPATADIGARPLDWGRRRRRLRRHPAGDERAPVRRLPRPPADRPRPRRPPFRPRLLCRRRRAGRPARTQHRLLAARPPGAPARPPEAGDHPATPSPSRPRAARRPS